MKHNELEQTEMPKFSVPAHKDGNMKVVIVPNKSDSPGMTDRMSSSVETSPLPKPSLTRMVSDDANEAVNILTVLQTASTPKSEEIDLIEECIQTRIRIWSDHKEDLTMPHPTLETQSSTSTDQSDPIIRIRKYSIASIDEDEEKALDAAVQALESNDTDYEDDPDEEVFPCLGQSNELSPNAFLTSLAHKREFGLYDRHPNETDITSPRRRRRKGKRLPHTTIRVDIKS